MLACVPKNPQPLTHRFGSDGEKLVLSFCSEPIFSYAATTKIKKENLELKKRK